MASFAGDSYYRSANSFAQAIVFAYLAKGSFDIGDKVASVGQNVTIWSAKWSMLNPMTGGSAPSSFKGFAATLSTTPPTCGANWSTATGNASSPPAAPLPSYLAVVVSSGVVQSSSTVVSGSSPHVVIVRTDSGYQPDPSYSGTGTVVATIC
jgi:hypothetical protein